METGCFDRKLIGSQTAGACIPTAMLLSLLVGQRAAAPIAALLAMAGWLSMGKVRKLRVFPWLALGFAVCVLSWYRDANRTWADVLLLYGSAVMLYQSLDKEGKHTSKEWGLWIAAAAAFLAIVELYAAHMGCHTGIGGPVRLMGLLGSPETAGLFFSMAALSDDSPRRRFLFCVALGMTGSGLGLLCLGTGLLFKKADWVADTLWSLIGLSFFLFPSLNFWFLFTAFLFWCIPETLECIGKGAEKWAPMAFVLSLFNPLSFGMMKEWGRSAWDMLRNWGWHIFAGTGSGTELSAGGIVQAAVELGLIVALILVVCMDTVIRHPAGYAWMIHLLLGASAFIPAPFLLGAGTGMGDSGSEVLVDGRKFFLFMLAMCLYLC